MLLPILGGFLARNPSGMALGLDYVDSSRGNHHMVDLGSAAVGGGEHQVVEDDELSSGEAPQLLAHHLLAEPPLA